MRSHALDVSIFEFDESTNQSDLHFQPIPPTKLEKLKEAAKQAAACDPYSQYRIDDEWISGFRGGRSRSWSQLPSRLDCLLADILQGYEDNEPGVWHCG